MSDNKNNENELLEDTSKTINQEIDPIAEANESLITMNSAPFDQALEVMSQTLASIDGKMDVENLQLQQLDQLSEIKDQLNRLENTSLATANEKVIPAPDITSEIENETEEDLPQSSIGHNQQEISELLEKIQTLENKIQAIENQSNSSNERFEKIENVVERFEDLKNEIQVEYEEEEEEPSLFKNLFKKKEKSEPYKKEIIIDEPQIQANNGIPKDTKNIIEEAEDSLKNTNNEILINEDYEDELYKEDQKPKSKNLNYVLGMLLLLTTIIVILLFFNKFQIIDLKFNNVTSSVFSLIDSILR